MPQGSPIRAGFDSLRREPAVVLAEVAWRWTFGAAAMALGTASLMVYLNTLTVSRAEMWALRSKAPWLMADAVVHILEGSGPRLALILFLVTAALTIAWIVTASMGRAATLARLCHEATASPTLAQSVKLGHPTFRRVILLHVVRVVFFFACAIAYVGVVILAGRAAGTGSEPSFGVYALVFILLAMVITFAHSRVTWLASVAAIFVVRYDETVVRAMQRSGALFIRRPGQITKINTVFGLVHFVLFVVASFMSLAGCALFGQVPAGIALAVVGLITLGYFAFADFLYIARLAAYVALIESDEMPVVPAPAQPEPALPSPPPLESPA